MISRMKRDILYPLRLIHGMCHSALVYLKSSLALIFMKKVYVLGSPEHTNLGDAAIVIAQKRFIEQNGSFSGNIVEISLERYNDFCKLPLKFIHKGSVITLVGGGNMGDVWFYDEDIRRKIITDFPKNKKIIFPQTCYYSDTEKGHAEKLKSVEIYNQAKNLTIVAREQKSFDTVKSLYPNADILLVPDIVLSTSAEDFNAEKKQRNNILLCMRNDKEKLLEDKKTESIKEFLSKNGFGYAQTDTHSDIWCYADRRGQLVKQKLEEFLGARLVITDRLHGMIFAAITGTPCIALSNYNHKISGTYEFIKYLPYVRFVKTEEEIKAAFYELISMENCQYDNTPLLPYYEKLAEALKQK